MDIAIRDHGINYIQIEIVPFIINLMATVLLDMDKFKSQIRKRRFSIRFNWSSAGYNRSTNKTELIVERKT